MSPSPAVAADLHPAVEALQALVRIPTVGVPDPAGLAGDDPAAERFERFHAELARRFPLLHARLELQRVGGFGLLARWAGDGPDARARAVVLMAHLDVVPAGDTGRWSHDPFGGQVHDGRVWGRGTLDCKGPLVAVCAAVEELLAAGFAPAHDLWLSFGCDEETTGASARAAVAELHRRGVEPWLVLDEGGAVATQALPGVQVPLGVIGVAEKGATELRLSASGDGGHASTPRRGEPTARVAAAVARVDAVRHPDLMPAVTLEMVRRLAGHLPAPLGALLTAPVPGRDALLRPVVQAVLGAAGPEAAAMVRTTSVATTFTGSPAANVVATRAEAVVNVRVMVGDGVAAVLGRVRRAVRDPRVRVEVVTAGEPTPVSPLDGAFEAVATTVRQVFPDAVPVPYVMLAASDARFFTDLCPRVYRFAPLRMDRARRASIHGPDENVGVIDFLDALRWYREFVKTVCGPDDV